MSELSGIGCDYGDSNLFVIEAAAEKPTKPTDTPNLPYPPKASSYWRKPERLAPLYLQPGVPTPESFRTASAMACFLR